MTDDQQWQAPEARPAPDRPRVDDGASGPVSDSAPAAPPPYGPPAAPAVPPPYGAPAASPAASPVPPPYGPPAATPAASPVPPPYGAPASPPFGETAAPPPFGGPAVPPPFGASGAPAPGQPGWTPPPKPGLVPLRPMTLGTILGASFQVLRRNPRPTFGISLLVQGAVYLLTLVVVGVVTFLAVSRIANAAPEDQEALEAGAVGTIVLSALVPILLSLIASAVLQGIIVLEVSRATLGEKLRVPGLWRLAKGRIGALIGWTLLVVAVVTVGVVALVLVIGVVAAVAGEAGVALAVVIGLLAFLGGVVLWFWLSTKLAFVPSAIVLERLTIGDAVRRSWSLTGGWFWRILGIQLLVGVIVNAASQVVVTPVTFLAQIALTLFIPSAGTDPNAFIGAAIGITLLTGLVTIVAAAVVSVVQSSATALLYIDTRMRKEGLDLELSRFVEARQVGQVGVGNPYERDAAFPTDAAPGSASPTDSPWA